MAFLCELGAFVVQIGFYDSANGYDIIEYAIADLSSLLRLLLHESG